MLLQMLKPRICKYPSFDYRYNGWGNVNVLINRGRLLLRTPGPVPLGLEYREKVGDLTQSYDKTPYTNRKFENQRTTHTNATKNFDYTTIADRLRTVSWSNK